MYLFTNILITYLQIAMHTHVTSYGSVLVFTNNNNISNNKCLSYLFWMKVVLAAMIVCWQHDVGYGK